MRKTLPVLQRGRRRKSSMSSRGAGAEKVPGPPEGPAQKKFQDLPRGRRRTSSRIFRRVGASQGPRAGSEVREGRGFGTWSGSAP